MNHFTDFITKYGNQTQFIFFIGLLFIAWNIENAAGIIFNYKKWNHAFGNTLFIFTNMPGQLLLGLLFVKIIQWTGAHHFGLLYTMHINKSIIFFILTFILLDFGEYIYHVIMHKIKRLLMYPPHSGSIQAKTLYVFLLHCYGYLFSGLCFGL
jgi:sterol desaturase/sphingolipid hydroxylase (fatty acid hydroxylase superfamily)